MKTMKKMKKMQIEDALFLAPSTRVRECVLGHLLVEIVFHLICASLMRVVWVNGGWRLSQQDRAAP